MGFANLLRRGERRPDARPEMAKRPASATASAEFWSAFLGQNPRPASLHPADEMPKRSARAAIGDPSTEAGQRSEPGAPSVEPEAIARELGLSRFASVRALQRLRRDFALKNHPDRMPSTLRGRATKRMMIANAMIDSAMKRFQFRGARNDRTQPFESGERV